MTAPTGEEAGRLWVVVYLPALAISLLVLLRIANELCGIRARRVLLSGLLLLCVAVAAEIVGAGTRRLTGSLEVLHVAEVAIEEASEAAGWLLIAVSLTAIALGAVAAAGPRAHDPTEPS